MKSFVEAMWEQLTPVFSFGHELTAQGRETVQSFIDFFLSDRDERFREGNDKMWGEGNWKRCMEPGCTDTLGYPSYHHNEARP